MGVEGQHHAPDASTPGKDPIPILLEAGWTSGQFWTGGKSRPHRNSIADHPASSQSLYRLSYQAHGFVSLCLIFPTLKHTERLVSGITHFNCTHFFLRMTLPILHHSSQSNLEHINLFSNLFYWIELSANNYKEVYSILRPALFNVSTKKFHTLTLKVQRSTFPSLSPSSRDLDLHLGNNPTADMKTGTLTTALLIYSRQMSK